MGYFSEMDIELQNQEAEERGVEIEVIEEEREFDWQAEQAADEAAEERRLAMVELNDPDNLTGWMDSGDGSQCPCDIGGSVFCSEHPIGEGEFGIAELAHIEAQAEIQENIHNGYWD
jgi:hypothetical protein